MANTDEQRCGEIFLPYATHKFQNSERRNGRLVHYTSAKVAASILNNKGIWMWNATTMNDFLEIQYGWHCLTSACNSNLGVEFREVVESISPGFCSRLEHQLTEWKPRFKTGTYHTCISEHLNSEDEFGRLSMWRAYGRNTGVALVFNTGLL